MVSPVDARMGLVEAPAHHGRDTGIQSGARPHVRQG